MDPSAETSWAPEIPTLTPPNFDDPVAHSHTHTLKNSYTHTPPHSHIHTNTHPHPHTHTFIHTFTLTFIYTHSYIHTHTHTFSHNNEMPSFPGAGLDRPSPCTLEAHLGMPRVTFISPLPAKWKVFRVICVEGSPMLWAASRPTASPGSHSERCHLSCSRVLRLETGWGDIRGQGHRYHLPITS